MSRAYRLASGNMSPAQIHRLLMRLVSRQIARAESFSSSAASRKCHFMIDCFLPTKNRRPRYNESRAAAETAAEKGWDVYIGSHDIWTPVEFLSQLQTLSDVKASAVSASDVKSSPNTGVIDSEV